MKKESTTYIQETEITQNKQDHRRKYPQHIIAKTLSVNNRESVWKASREKLKSYKKKNNTSE